MAKLEFSVKVIPDEGEEKTFSIGLTCDMTIEDIDTMSLGGATAMYRALVKEYLDIEGDDPDNNPSWLRTIFPK